jgi:hypothetical protein
VTATPTVADVVLTGLDGVPFELARYRGRRHLLFVWASW